jgi:hypothetical protein
MSGHRAALTDLLRPRLRPPGFNDAAFLRDFDALLDAAGVPRDAAPSVPDPAPSPTAISARYLGRRCSAGLATAKRRR